MQIKLTNIKEQVGQRLHHPYLLQFIENPVIDEVKLLLLLSVMEQQQLSESEVENLSVTTSLIQIALDTHEHVSNSVDAAEDYFTLKNRELLVLAGDYYSGLYYKLLAESGNITFIRQLAIGIKEINEHKIYLYRDAHSNLEQFMNSLMKIEAALYEKVCDYFNEPVWKELTVNLLFAKRLFDEMNKFEQSGTSLLLDSLSRCLFGKDKTTLSTLKKEQRQQLLAICSEQMSVAIGKLQHSMKQLPPMNHSLENYLKSFFQHYEGKTVVGEG